MKKYKGYELEDFLMDEYFISWVKSSDNEAEHFWKRWIENNPSKKKVVMEAYYIISSMNYGDPIRISDEEHIEIFESILKHDKEDQRTGLFDKINLPFFFRNVAAVLLIVFCGYYGFQIINFGTSPTVEEIQDSRQVVKMNPAGQKSQIRLNDGTTVFLNSESKLTFPDRFNDSVRIVHLEGEAYFEVQKNDDKPFVVMCDDVEIKVLGTSFNVKNDGDVAIALVTGKVQAKKKEGEEVMLSPNEMVTYNHNGKYTKSEFDPLETLGWKDRYLVFKKDDFKSVKTKLEKWYGVEIVLTSNLGKKWEYTGQYFHETLENVLEGIAASSEIDFRIDKNKVYISQKTK
ncbi:FecR family protein [Belliella marina]|uniref:FecR family protein n=1 Tax=Belliella marina TaxID=1644146 RepID=A0ABW4VJA4_9BACT